MPKKKWKSKSIFADRMERRSKQSPGYHRSSKMEKETAKKFGGFRIRGSGSGNLKGDVRVKGLARIECKTTQAKSFRVTREMWDKITDAAVGVGELPIIEVEFLDERAKPLFSLSVVDTDALQRLIYQADENS